MTKNSLICALVSSFQTFFWYHAEYHTGAWWPTVSFFKVLDQDGLWSKKKKMGSVIWETTNACPIRTESKERRQEPLTKNIFIWIDCL